MVNEFCGFKHGVIGTDKMPADTTLSNMKKEELIKLLHTAQNNYETLMWFYNNAVKVNMSQLNNNGWISCSEDKPKKNGWYECWYKTSAVGENKYYEPITLYWEDNIWLYRPNKFAMPAQSDVVAWKPIAPYINKPI